MSYGDEPPVPPAKPAPGGNGGVVNVNDRSATEPPPPRPVDLAAVAQVSADHAAAIENMKSQLLIVLINRLGGSASIPVAEIDNTGPYVLSMQLTGRSFLFVVERKQ